MAASEEGCNTDPNFAVICSFITKFGSDCGINITIPYLQQVLEDTKNVAEDLKELHIHLLRKGRKRVTKEKWEKSLVKFCHEYSSVDAWELERFGYKKAKLSVKLQLLKHLLELQFDSNAKFKSEVNKHEAISLRLLPIGRDIEGQMYWYQLDKEYNMRLYRQGADGDSLWELLCSSKEGLENILLSLEQKSENKIFSYSKENVKNELLSNEVLSSEIDVKSPKEESGPEEFKSCLSEVKPCTLIIKSEKNTLQPPVENLKCSIVKETSNITETDKADEVKFDCSENKSETGSVIKLKEDTTEISIKTIQKFSIETQIDKNENIPSNENSETTLHIKNIPSTEISNESSETILQNKNIDSNKLPSSSTVSSKQTNSSCLHNIDSVISDSQCPVVVENYEETKHKGSKIKLYEKWNKEKKKQETALASSLLKCANETQSAEFEDSVQSCLNKQNITELKKLVPEQHILSEKEDICSLPKSINRSEETPMDLSTSGKLKTPEQSPLETTTENSNIFSAVSQKNSKKSELTSKDETKVISFNALESEHVPSVSKPLKKKLISMVIEETPKENSEPIRQSVIFEVKNKNYNCNHNSNQHITETTAKNTQKNLLPASSTSHLQALQNMCESNLMGGLQKKVIQCGSLNKSSAESWKESQFSTFVSSEASAKVSEDIELKKDELCHPLEQLSKKSMIETDDEFLNKTEDIGEALNPQCSSNSKQIIAMCDLAPEKCSAVQIKAQNVETDFKAVDDCLNLEAQKVIPVGADIEAKLGKTENISNETSSPKLSDYEKPTICPEQKISYNLCSSTSNDSKNSIQVIAKFDESFQKSFNDEDKNAAIETDMKTKENQSCDKDESLYKNTSCAAEDIIEVNCKSKTNFKSDIESKDSAEGSNFNRPDKHLSNLISDVASELNSSKMLPVRKDADKNELEESTCDIANVCAQLTHNNQSHASASNNVNGGSLPAASTGELGINGKVKNQPCTKSFQEQNCSETEEIECSTNEVSSNTIRDKSTAISLQTTNSENVENCHSSNDPKNNCVLKSNSDDVILEKSKDSSTASITEKSKDSSTAFITEKSKDSPTASITEKSKDSSTASITEKSKDSSIAFITEKSKDSSTASITEKSKDSSTASITEKSKDLSTASITEKSSILSPSDKAKSFSDENKNEDIMKSSQELQVENDHKIPSCENSCNTKVCSSTDAISKCVVTHGDLSKEVKISTSDGIATNIERDSESSCLMSEFNLEKGKNVSSVVEQDFKSVNKSSIDPEVESSVSELLTKIVQDVHETESAISVTKQCIRKANLRDENFTSASKDTKGKEDELKSTSHASKSLSNGINSCTLPSESYSETVSDKATVVSGVCLNKLEDKTTSVQEPTENITDIKLVGNEEALKLTDKYKHAENFKKVPSVVKDDSPSKCLSQQSCVSSLNAEKKSFGDFQSKSNASAMKVEFPDISGSSTTVKKETSEIALNSEEASCALENATQSSETDVNKDSSDSISLSYKENDTVDVLKEKKRKIVGTETIADVNSVTQNSDVCNTDVLKSPLEKNSLKQVSVNNNPSKFDVNSFPEVCIEKNSNDILSKQKAAVKGDNDSEAPELGRKCSSATTSSPLQLSQDVLTHDYGSDLKNVKILEESKNKNQKDTLYCDKSKDNNEPVITDLITHKAEKEACLNDLTELHCEKAETSSTCDPFQAYLFTSGLCRETKSKDLIYKVSCTGALRKVDSFNGLNNDPKLTELNEDVSIDKTNIPLDKPKKRGRLRKRGRRLNDNNNVLKTDDKVLTSIDAVHPIISDEKSKSNFSIPEGFLEILENSDMRTSKSKVGRKRGRKPISETHSVQSSESESTPIKRSRRIQAQHEKKISELAVEIEKEQRRLEQLAKKSSSKKCSPKPKPKEVKSPKSNHSKFQPPTPDETLMESKRTTRKMNSRSRNMTKMTLMYEEESKSSEFSTSRDTDRSKKRRGGHSRRKGYKPWDLSSESSSTTVEISEEEEEEEEPEEQLIFTVNEDEFACEELDESAEPVVVRRARTAKKAEMNNEVTVIDDKPCSKCGKFDHPEWILLCDKCDNGYHTSCLVPPLMLIPEGDWYCLPCEHMFLCECIQRELRKLEQFLKQKEREELRKQRLAYVGISLDNVLKPEKKEKSEESSESEEKVDDEEANESNEENTQSSLDDKYRKLYGKRSVRARRNVNYQFKEYDELIASAIQEEMVYEKFEDNEFCEEKEEKDEDSDESFRARESIKRKKPKRLNDLDYSDEDSGEEYKGLSTDSEHTPVASSNGSESAASGEWRIVKPSKKTKRKRRHSSEEEWESDESDHCRPSTRRAAQKNISYREISSEEEWGGGKSKKTSKRKKDTSEEGESGESFRKPKRKSRVRNWGSSESDSEKSDEASESESSPASEDEWKVKKSIKINKKAAREEEEEESSSSGESVPKKRINRLISDDSDEEEEEEDESKQSADEASSKVTSKTTEKLSVAVEQPKEATPSLPPEPRAESQQPVKVVERVPPKPVKKEATKMVPCTIPYVKSPKSNLAGQAEEEGHAEVAAEKPVLAHPKAPTALPAKTNAPARVALPTKLFSSASIAPRSTIVEPFNSVEDDIESDEEIPLERIPARAPPTEPLTREDEYRPAKQVSSFQYAEEQRLAASSLQDYPSRPSPLQPSMVETYPSHASPSKLTPLDNYSRGSSPKGFLSLDSYTEARKRPFAADLLPRTTTDQGEIRFAPDPYPAPSSPHSTYSQFPDAYAPPRSPEYYQNHQYYAGEERMSRPSYQPNYVPPEQHGPNFVSNPYVATPVPQPNGGFMIDTLLRARNPENEEDELTGVTDIFSYITQE